MVFQSEIVYLRLTGRGKVVTEDEQDIPLRERDLYVVRRKKTKGNTG